MTRRLLLVLTLAALALPSGAAAVDCTSDLPVSDRRAAHHECAGVHPGMGLVVPSKKWGPVQCTAGFGFADQFGSRYLTFPGHCFLDYDCLEDVARDVVAPLLDPSVVPQLPTCLLPSDSEEEPVYKRNGPVVTDVAGRRVGMIVYAVNKDGVDFALLKLDPAVKLDHQLPLYGGPAKADWSPGGPVEEAYVYSAPNSLPFPNARAGLLHASGTRRYVHVDSLSVTTGSPVVTPAGAAVGYLSGTNYVGFGMEILRYDAALARTTSRTGLRLRMLLAPTR